MTTCKYVVVGVAFGMNLVTLPALSQTYPGKPVRVVVGFAAGGNIDIPARIVAAKLSEMWATPVVVDNRPGAGGNIAAEFVAKAAPDGYTLLMCNAASHGINPSIYGKIPFDPIKDFAPISKIGSNGNVLLVHPSSQLTTVNAFIGYAKANPGKISIGSAGVGTSQHLSIELFKSMTGTSLVHVPYKGGTSALADLLGAQIPAMLSGVPTALTSIKAGKVRALGVTTAIRSSQLPEVPTIAEAGVPGFEVTSWSGLCAPAGTPKSVIAKLNADVVKALGMPDTQRRLAEQGVDAVPTTPDLFADFIKSEVAKWPKIVKDAGISAE